MPTPAVHASIAGSYHIDRSRTKLKFMQITARIQPAFLAPFPLWMCRSVLVVRLHHGILEYSGSRCRGGRAAMSPDRVTGPLGPRRAIANAVRKLREDRGRFLNEVARDLMMST